MYVDRNLVVPGYHFRDSQQGTFHAESRGNHRLPEAIMDAKDKVKALAFVVKVLCEVDCEGLSPWQLWTLFQVFGASTKLLKAPDRICAPPPRPADGFDLGFGAYPSGTGLAVLFNSELSTYNGAHWVYIHITEAPIGYDSMHDLPQALTPDRVDTLLANADVVFGVNPRFSTTHDDLQAASRCRYQIGQLIPTGLAYPTIEAKMSSKLLSIEVDRCVRMHFHNSMKKNVNDARAELRTDGATRIPLNVILSTLYMDEDWHRMGHFGLTRFNIDKILTTAADDVTAIRGCTRWADLSTKNVIVFLRDALYGRQGYDTMEHMLTACTEHGDGGPIELRSNGPAMRSHPATVEALLYGPKNPTDSHIASYNASHVVSEGSVYDVRYPRLMENIKLTDKNRAFVDEVGHVVSVLHGKRMVCWDANVLTGGRAQQLHCDWVKSSVRWSSVIVVLFFPSGGSFVNDHGIVETIYTGGALVFDGYEYVHAGGPDLAYDSVRVHMVFVPIAEQDYHTIASLQPIETKYSTKDNLENGVDPLAVRYGSAKTDADEAAAKVATEDRRRAKVLSSLSRKLELQMNPSGADVTERLRKRTRHGNTDGGL